MDRRTSIVCAALLIACAPATVLGQTTRLHLHNEQSSTTAGLLQLKATGPDIATVAAQSADLKSHGAEDSYLRTFLTEPGIPNLGGTIAANATVSFTLWMKKTSANGTVFPRAQLSLNWPVTATIATCNGSGQITTTLQAITFQCTVPSSLTMTTSDRLSVLAGYHMTAGPGNKSMKVELDIEGLNSTPVTDSYVDAPNPVPPTITSLSLTSGYVGQAVTVTGTNFGSVAGTVTFNGTAASIGSWSSTSISTSVPAGIAPGAGPVIVTVGGQASNGVTFTAVPHITSLNPTSGQMPDAVTVSGTTFGASQGSSTVTFNGTAATPTAWGNSSVTVPIPFGATTGSVVVTVAANASNGSAFTVIAPTITSLDTSVAIPGQSVTITGTHFRATQAQASSTVTFNGVAASPTSWSDTSISAPVPTGAATGPVVVTVGGVASNGASLTIVTTGIISGTITKATGGSALSGATVQAVLTGMTKGTATRPLTGRTQSRTSIPAPTMSACWRRGTRARCEAARTCPRTSRRR